MSSSFEHFATPQHTHASLDSATSRGRANASSAHPSRRRDRASSSLSHISSLCPGTPPPFEVDIPYLIFPPPRTPPRRDDDDPPPRLRARAAGV
mmetsp:Transcript_10550/g.33730  ORF Transcript_10550/g.33730 Transcript_10550/m.33730 type:complete len:94 (-) Transcript_10550:3-284(-)